MKKITLLFLIFSLGYFNIDAQTVVWSSDVEDFTGWSISDLDSDGNNWQSYATGFDPVGFTGSVFASQSWATVALTPDNLLFTPTFLLPATAVTTTYKMKVGASFTPDFAEHYAVYVYDDAIGPSFNDNILEETLTAGGAASAKIVTASIPATFAGKTIGIIIRHYNCTNQEYLVVDDFEVSYTTSLFTEDNVLNIARVYPNPFIDNIKIDTNEIIDVISINNQLGQRVIHINRRDIINNEIDLKSLPQGLYFMTIKAEEKITSIKIIKK